MSVMALMFTLVCTGWGVIVGSILMTALTSLKRAFSYLIPSMAVWLVNISYWMAIAVSLAALHFGYVSEDDIGRHIFATIGFYLGIAASLAIKPAKWRAAFSQIA
ncbi:hypothetical protein [Pseudomonas sp. NPDC090208]|uniref:hypothetical protein n=1 Tax=Pseudomonas sp. NPDC090208 TaxID=3364478 RepID=UPI003820E322